jgi:hypothetical protein
MIGGADKGSFIPVTFALVPEAPEAMKTRYSQPVVDFPFDKDVFTPFGGEWDSLVCKFENMFKEISNRSLALKHALWKEDLWLADDLTNDNYFSALDARADLETERYAMHTKCAVYKDKRRNASSNGSSVIADLTFFAAKYEKTRSDFYSKSGAGASFSASSSGSTSGSGSWAGSGWSHPTVTGPSASTYSQLLFPPHERPAEPIELHRDRRKDWSASADYWRRSEHHIEQTKAKGPDRLRHSPSEQHGFRRPDLFPIRSNSADQRGSGVTQVQEQRFW